MTEALWRPLGIADEGEIAEYDALHDGVPTWMKAGLWEWIRAHLRITKQNQSYRGRLDPYLDVETWEAMGQALRLDLPNYRRANSGDSRVDAAVLQLQVVRASGLQVADYLLAHKKNPNVGALDDVLARSKSAWHVGTRAERPALTRRVSLGVQVAADDVMSRANRAGVRLAKAWEALYGIAPDPSTAYGLAIKAVEDAAVPVVSPTDRTATLGKVIKKLEDQRGWGLPMQREHDEVPSIDVVINMARMLWHGQHDRHGGQPSAPGDVSIEEATVAVSLAVSLVHLFTSGLVTRSA